jgi:hypothetical protein
MHHQQLHILHHHQVDIATGVIEIETEIEKEIEDIEMMIVAEITIDDEKGNLSKKNNFDDCIYIHLYRYMRDMRYESSSYGAPPPNYQMPPYGGDSYRPERDRDREMPPSPSSHLPYYERDRLDDRDYYSRGPRSSGSSGPMDYDRYRSSGRGRPIWGPNKLDDNRRMMDRDRPERITTNVEIRSGRTSPTSATTTTANYPNKDRPSEVLKSDDKKEELEPRSNVESSKL